MKKSKMCLCCSGLFCSFGDFTGIFFFFPFLDTIIGAVYCSVVCYSAKPENCNRHFSFSKSLGLFKQPVAMQLVISFITNVSFFEGIPF